MHQHLSRHPPSRVCRSCVRCPCPVGGARRGAKRPRVQRALGGRLERREGQRRIRTCHRKIKGLRFSAFHAKREMGANPSCNCRCRDPPSTPLGPCAPLPPCLFGPLCSLPPLAHVRESAEPRSPSGRSRAAPASHVVPPAQPWLPMPLARPRLRRGSSQAWPRLSSACSFPLHIRRHPRSRRWSCWGSLGDAGTFGRRASRVLR